jgi:hypothetical protein
MDRQGRLAPASTARRVTSERNGRIEVLVDKFEGNDQCAQRHVVRAWPSLHHPLFTSLDQRIDLQVFRDSQG